MQELTAKLARARELLTEAEKLVSQCYPSDAPNALSLALTVVAANVTKARKSLDMIAL